MNKHIRKPEDEDDERLLRDGWSFAGISMYRHPGLAYLGAVTKQQALEEHMGFYCSACGACGEEGCCNPDKCKCMYGEHYKLSYKELLEENEKLYNLYNELMETHE